LKIWSGCTRDAAWLQFDGDRRSHVKAVSFASSLTVANSQRPPRLPVSRPRHLRQSCQRLVSLEGFDQSSDGIVRNFGAVQAAAGQEMMKN